MSEDSESIGLDVAEFQIGQFDKEGVLLKQKGTTESDQKKNNFSTKYVILHKGGLFIYQHQMKGTPKLRMRLAKETVVEPYTSSKHKHCFSVSSEGNLMVFAAKNKDEAKSWMSAVKKGSGKDFLDGLDRKLAKKKGTFFRASKNLAEGVAAGSLGRKVVKRFAPEADIILTNVLRLIELHKGKERSKAFEKTVLKVCVKASSLYQGKHLSDKDFQAVRLPVLRVWNNFVDCEMAFSRDLDMLSRFIKILHQHLDDLLRPHLSPKTMNSVGEVCDYLSSVETLEFAFSDDPEIQKLCSLSIELLRKIFQEQIGKKEQELVLADSLKQMSMNAPEAQTWAEGQAE